MIKRTMEFPFLPKDFIQTREGLIFAVVSYQNHDNKIGCFLRYVPKGNSWQKVNTIQANELLQENFPQYLYHSKQADAEFHAVPIEKVTVHHRPELRLQNVLQHQHSCDEIEKKLRKLIAILNQFSISTSVLGLTGSMLINQQKLTSDIDLVVYGRRAFRQVRQAIQRAISQGLITNLDYALMKENFDKRSSELSFDTFTWHENRKFNKAAIDNCKFDIGMVCLHDKLRSEQQDHYQKLGLRIFKTRVTKADRAFDFPARYSVDDEEIPEILSFTHTYVGQAQEGETIEVAGMVERNTTTGQCRLIVGSTREAQGEYIKVILERQK